MKQTAGETEMTAKGGDVHSRMHIQSGPETTDHGHNHALRSGLNNVRERASNFAGRARASVESTVERAGEVLQKRDALVDTIRENPLTSVGIALTIGIIAAIRPGRRKSNWIVERARRQLRALMISGVTAAVVHEFKEAIGAEEGIGGMVSSLIGSDDDDSLDEEEYLDEDEFV